MSKFKEFLTKASKSVPELLTVAGKLATGNVGGAIEEVGNILGDKAKESKEAKNLLIEFELHKLDFEKEIFELEHKEKKSARKLYATDSIIQKIFAITFLIGYGFLCWYMLDILKGTNDHTELFKTMITMIFTATSTKLNTIVDFLFGSSFGG